MKCNVVKDLLALYADDACSDETKAEIEEHLKTCDECSKELENYKKKIEVKKKNYKDNKEIKPFKKIRMRQRIFLIILAVLALFFVVFQVKFKYKHMEYLSVSYIKTYLEVKKQHEYLLNGEIDKYVENLACKDMEIKIKSTNKKEPAKKYIKIEIEELYKNYIKGKEVKRVNYFVSPKIEGTNNRWADINMQIKGVGTIFITYAWDNNDNVIFNIHPQSGKNKQLNLACDTLNVYFTPDKKDYFKDVKFSENSDIYCSINCDNGHYDKLYNRKRDLCKETKTVKFKFSIQEYNPIKRQFERDCILTLKENKTGKKVTLKQTFTEAYGSLYPHDDQRLVNNEGVSKELEKQLLELF